jgi:uncharacterized protein (DUF362 family)
MTAKNRDLRGKGGIGRRDFLRSTAALAAGAMLGCSGDGPARSDARPVNSTSRDSSTCGVQPSPLSPPTGEARVVDVSDAAAVKSDGTFDASRVRAMLLAGLRELAGESDLTKAWKALIPDFAPSMRIGLKLNCLSPQLANAVPLVRALVQTLVEDLGADPQRILVWDRRGDELARGRLTEASLGAKVMGSVASIADQSGPGYETKAECCLARPVHLARILTEQTDITINLPLLKTHGVAGITGALKNTYGCIDDPGALHDDLNHHLPALYRLDRLRQRFRLHITDGLLAVLRGDTSDPPDSLPGRILLSADPLALDVHALSVANTLREDLPPIDTSLTGWIEEAGRLNLGSSSPVVKSIVQP